MLVTDQHCRPTLSEALAHEWLAATRDVTDVARLVPAFPLQAHAPPQHDEQAASSDPHAEDQQGGQQQGGGHAAAGTCRQGHASGGHRGVRRPMGQQAGGAAGGAGGGGQQAVTTSSSRSQKSWSSTDFEIGKPVGRGRYGSVFMCRERASGRLLALKVLFKQRLKEDGVVRQVGPAAARAAGTKARPRGPSRSTNSG